MNLREHLAHGYDHYQRGKMKGWTKAHFVEELRNDRDLVKAARIKLSELDAVKRSMRRCAISDVHHNVLSDALRSLDANPPPPITVAQDDYDL